MPEATIVSPAQARRAAAQYRRLIRGDLGGLIGAVEEALEPLASSYLPVRRPPKGTPEAELANRLRDERGRSLRLGGQAVVQSDVWFGMDELVDELARRAGPGGGGLRPEVLVDQLAEQIREVHILRGRGGRYGAIRNGLELVVTRRLVDARLTDWLAAGRLGATAAQFRAKVLEELARPAESPRTDLRRRIYFRLADRGAEDWKFAEVFSDLMAAGLLEYLMDDPARPRWCSWQRLTADYLGILPNTGPV